jgi:hypothetical protein
MWERISLRPSEVIQTLLSRSSRSIPPRFFTQAFRWGKARD